jgi:hypothetical protein
MITSDIASRQKSEGFDCNAFKHTYVPKPEGAWPIALKPQSSKTSFTCMAVGNIDNDSDLDVWSINNAKMLINEHNDI